NLDKTNPINFQFDEKIKNAITSLIQTPQYNDAIKFYEQFDMNNVTAESILRDKAIEAYDQNTAKHTQFDRDDKFFEELSELSIPSLIIANNNGYLDEIEHYVAIALYQRLLRLDARLLNGCYRQVVNKYNEKYEEEPLDNSEPLFGKLSDISLKALKNATEKIKSLVKKVFGKFPWELGSIKFTLQDYMFDPEMPIELMPPKSLMKVTTAVASSSSTSDEERARNACIIVYKKYQSSVKEAGTKTLTLQIFNAKKNAPFKNALMESFREDLERFKATNAAKQESDLATYI